LTHEGLGSKPCFSVFFPLQSRGVFVADAWSTEQPISAMFEGCFPERIQNNHGNNKVAEDEFPNGNQGF